MSHEDVIHEAGDTEHDRGVVHSDKVLQDESLRSAILETPSSVGIDHDVAVRLVETEDTQPGTESDSDVRATVGDDKISVGELALCVECASCTVVVADVPLVVAVGSTGSQIDTGAVQRIEPGTDRPTSACEDVRQLETKLEFGMGPLFDPGRRPSRRRCVRSTKMQS